MKQALHAEWTKARTVAGTAWLLLATIALTIALSAGAAASVSLASAGSDLDTTRLVLTGVALGQAVIAILAVLVISSEYSTDMIGVTLAATPRRRSVLAAKAIVVGGLALGAGTVATLGSLLAGRLILPANGFTPGHGYALLSLTDGSTLRAAAGSVLYLALVALLSLGVAAAVRDPAPAIGVVLGLLFLFPVLAALAPDPDWQRRLQKLGPMSAGLNIQATTDIASLPLSPWAGLGVLAAWAAAALLAGGLLLCRRDA
jgi:ABC-2 type transport system permease protein